jgi:hypothetical protein
MSRLKKVTAKKVGRLRRGTHVIAKRTIGAKKVVAKRAGPKRAAAKQAATKADGLTKFQRYRRAKAHKGMKLLRIWVPDPASPEFAAEVERQAQLLRGRPEEEDALRFAEAVLADTITDEPEYFR